MTGTLHRWAGLLGGEVSSGQVLAPGPGHSPADRSMSVRVDSQAPEGFIAFSFAGDAWQDCRDHVKARLGIGDDQGRVCRRRNVSNARPAGQSERNAPLALDIWHQARRLDGSPATTFLSR
jgi:putative DNA primase/helicase